MINCLLWDRWMCQSLPAQSKLYRAVRMKKIWGRFCKILTKSFRGHHAVCTCFHQRQSQALSFFKVSSTEHVVDLNLMLRVSQQTLNMQREISQFQREGEKPFSFNPTSSPFTFSSKLEVMIRKYQQNIFLLGDTLSGKSMTFQVKLMLIKFRLKQNGKL